jgi:hypothetical protein
MLSAAATTAPPPELPRPNCLQRLVDAPDDSAPDYGGTKSVLANNAATDITGINLRLTADQLQVFVALKGMPSTAAMAPYESSYRYLVTFKFSGKNFTYGIEWKNTAMPVQPLDAPSYPTMNMGTGGADLPGSTADFYPGTGSNPAYVIFTSPRAKIEKNLGNTAIVPGDKFTDIYGLVQVWTSQEKAKADDTTVPVAQAVYVVGNDACFGPPPTTLKDVTASGVQWGDRSVLSATLRSETDAPVPGKEIQFVVAGAEATPLTATTDANGVATVTYKATIPAGPHGVTATFAGDADGAKSVAEGSLLVALEKVTFSALRVTKPSATTRVVTATLLDDDKAPAAGQRVTWYVNGAKVATLVTDAKGNSVYKAAKPGQYVQVKFAGLAGKYAAATSSRVRV